jgi:hypothetical protein
MRLAKVKPLRGIVTGYNDAFLIDSRKVMEVDSLSQVKQAERA